MSDDRRDEYYLRGRARYVRQHAHLALDAAASYSPNLTPREVARVAVELTTAVYDALPDNPDQEQGSGAPAQLDIPPLPAEQHPCHRSASVGEWRKWHGATTTNKALWDERTTNPKEWPNGQGLQAECRGCGSTLMARWEGAPGAAELLAAEPEDTARPVTRVRSAGSAPRVLRDCDPGPADPVQP